MQPNILYEDNHLIAVEKPAGVLTQGDKTGDISLYDMVKDYIRVKKGKGSLLEGNAKPRSETAVSTTGVFLGLLHRLDRPVSGIVLFAKTSKGASRLSGQIRNREFTKTYHAIVIGKPKEKSGKLVDYLQKDTKLKKATKVADGKRLPVGRQGQLAELDYEIVLSNNKYTLLKIQPKTGRFHQIRAQLSAAGFPILGDLKYGDKSQIFRQAGIALCATNISFKAATTKPFDAAQGLREISIPTPKEWEEYIR